MSKKYLLWFAQDNVHLRLPEIQSLVSLFNLSFDWTIFSNECPYTIIESSDLEGVKKVAERSLSLRSLFELYAYSKTQNDLNHQIFQHLEKFNDIFLHSSFRIMVECYGKKLTTSYKLAKINNYTFLPFKGKVNLLNPENSFHHIEYYGLDSNNIPNEPIMMFFAKFIASGARHILSQQSLSNRKFISTTSLDPKLSLIMANLAKVKHGDIVLDPFSGSGSILIGAATFGAKVLGSDIDYLLLHGKTKPCRSKVTKRDPDECTFANFKQYKMEDNYLDVLVADFSKPPWRKFPFDAIITDIPYGIREATSKVGSQKSYTIPKEYLPHHIPSKVVYFLDDLIKDLISFASHNLRYNGRLVFWIPKSDLTENIRQKLSHPSFELIYILEQSMRTNAIRMLICLEKISSLKVLPDT